MRSFLFFTIAIFSISTIGAQEITMFSGFTGYKYYQDDNEIDKKDLEALLYKNDEIKANWKKAKTQATIGGIALLAEFGFATWTGYEFAKADAGSNRAKDALGPALATVGTGIMAGIFMYASNSSKKKAILAYNKQFDDKTVYQLVPISNQNGMGLALKF